jgi:hypothetical protein
VFFAAYAFVTIVSDNDRSALPDDIHKLVAQVVAIDTQQEDASPPPTPDANGADDDEDEFDAAYHKNAHNATSAIVTVGSSELNTAKFEIFKYIQLTLCNQNATSSFGAVTNAALAQQFAKPGPFFVAIDWVNENTMNQYYDPKEDLAKSEPYASEATASSTTAAGAVRNNGLPTLDDCFDLFSLPEVLGENNKWYV